MTIRIRKLIGTVALLALVIVWALVAMAIAQPLLASANGSSPDSTTWSPVSAGCCPRCR